MTEDVTIYQNVVKKMLKNTGKRSTRNSTELLNSYLTKIGQSIAEEAGNLAEHSDRKTIQQKDVIKAIDNAEITELT
jgi:histone H3/H4